MYTVKTTTARGASHLSTHATFETAHAVLQAVIAGAQHFEKQVSLKKTRVTLRQEDVVLEQVTL